MGRGFENIPTFVLKFSTRARVEGNVGETLLMMQGGIAVDYYIGPGPVRVYLQIEMNTTTVQVWNVIGLIPSTTSVDAVILGAQRGISEEGPSNFCRSLGLRCG